MPLQPSNLKVKTSPKQSLLTRRPRKWIHIYQHRPCSKTERKMAIPLWKI